MPTARHNKGMGGVTTPMTTRLDLPLPGSLRMLRTCAIGVLTLTTLGGWTPGAWGQIVIRAPFVRVQVGGGVSVQAPFVNVNTSRAYPAPYAPAPVRIRE